MTNERTETHACDCISRQAAVDALCDNCNNTKAVCAHYPCKQYIAVEKLPSPQLERKTGKWIPQDYNRRNGYVTTTVYYYPKCSECGHSGSYDMSYCPSCGAYMGGEQDG